MRLTKRLLQERIDSLEHKVQQQHIAWVQQGMECRDKVHALQVRLTEVSQAHYEALKERNALQARLDSLPTPTCINGTDA